MSVTHVVERTTLRAHCLYFGGSFAIFISHSEAHQIRLRVTEDDHAKQLHKRTCAYDIELRGARDEDGAFVDATLLGLTPVLDVPPAEATRLMREWAESVGCPTPEEYDAERAAEREDDDGP
jgi:hypothetical protein